MLGPRPLAQRQRGRPPVGALLVAPLGDVLRQEVIRLGHRDRSLVVLNGEHVRAVAVADQFEDAPFVGPGGSVPLYRHCGHAVSEEARGGLERCNRGTLHPALSSRSPPWEWHTLAARQVAHGQSPLAPRVLSLRAPGPGVGPNDLQLPKCDPRNVGVSPRTPPTCQPAEVTANT